MKKDRTFYQLREIARRRARQRRKEVLLAQAECEMQFANELSNFATDVVMQMANKAKTEEALTVLAMTVRMAKQHETVSQLLRMQAKQLTE